MPALDEPTFDNLKLLEEIDEDEESRLKLTLFGRDVSKIPCFRNSCLTGLSAGIGAGFITFFATSRKKRSMDVAVGVFSAITLIYFGYCRYNFSTGRTVTGDMQKALRYKSIYEGSIIEKQIEGDIYEEELDLKKV